MKIHYKGYFFLTVVAITLIFSSCSKKQISPPFLFTPVNSTNGFVVSGIGFDSVFFQMNQGKIDSGYYDTSQRMTYIYTAGDNDSLNVELAMNFSGNKAGFGFAPLNSPDSILIGFHRIPGSVKRIYYSLPEKTVLCINPYENVNGRIVGAFSGAFVNLSNLTDTIQISKGRFSVRRTANIP